MNIERNDFKKNQIKRMAFGIWEGSPVPENLKHIKNWDELTTQGLLDSVLHRNLNIILGIAKAAYEASSMPQMQPLVEALRNIECGARNEDFSYCHTIAKNALSALVSGE